MAESGTWILQDRHLVGELVDLQLLGFDFFVAAGEQRLAHVELGISLKYLRLTLRQLRKQRCGQNPQRFRVHLSQLAR